MSDGRRVREGMWDRAYQVAVVVSDLDTAVAFYERLGIGPFTEGPSAHTTRRVVFGEEAPDARVRGKLAQMGNIEFELLQPVEGTTVQGEFLKTRGEGVVHLCAHTDDLDRDVAELTDLGYEVISWGELSDGGKFAYFDTRETGGLVLELFQPDSEWQ